MSRTFSFAIAVIVSMTMTIPSFGQIEVWRDDDPVTSGISATSGFLIVDQIADPTGDPDRVTVGQVSTLVSNTFSNMRPDPSAPQPVADAYIGKSFTFTMDYFVPANSSMANNLEQAFFLSLTYRDVDDVTIEQFTGGFIGFDTATDAGTIDTWQTIEVTGMVPAGSDEVVPLMVFNNGGTPQAGTAVLVDNVNFTINDVAVVETPVWFDEDPATMDVTGTSGGLIVNQIADPTGDPDRITVGEVDNSGSTQQFTNFRPDPAAPQPVPMEFIGAPFSYTIDYYVPSDSTMSQATNQSFFLSLNFRDDMGTSLQQQNNGFINFNNAQLDSWQQLIITGTVPDGAFDVVPLFVFNNQNVMPAGAAVYVDNINFSFQAVECVETKGCSFELGDVNNDGVVDLLDVAPFVDAITNGTFICEADVNEDDIVSLLDVAPFVDLLSGG